MANYQDYQKSCTDSNFRLLDHSRTKLRKCKRGGFAKMSALSPYDALRITRNSRKFYFLSAAYEGALQPVYMNYEWLTCKAGEFTSFNSASAWSRINTNWLHGIHAELMQTQCLRLMPKTSDYQAKITSVAGSFTNKLQVNSIANYF